MCSYEASSSTQIIVTRIKSLHIHRHLSLGRTKRLLSFGDTLHSYFRTYLGDWNRRENKVSAIKFPSSGLVSYRQQRHDLVQRLRLSSLQLHIISNKCYFSYYTIFCYFRIIIFATSLGIVICLMILGAVSSSVYRICPFNRK